MDKFDLILIGFFPIMIVINIGIFKLLVKSVLTEFVKPELNSKGLVFESYKWAGFFRYKDFNEKIAFRPALMLGSPLLSYFIYVYYKDAKSEKKVTVKIDTLMLFIKKVSYSKPI